MRIRHKLVLGVILVLLGFSGLRGGEGPDAGQSVPASEELVPLELELPKPLFVGTPPNIKTPNLEEPTGEKRPPLLVPKGVSNIALGKSVSSSDEYPLIGELDQVTDGDKEGLDGSFVELGPGLQYVQIDLARTYEIFAIVVWHYHAQAQVYRDIIVRIADDPDFVVNVRTLFNNDHDNSAGFGIGKHKEYIETHEGKIIDGKGEKARYVRLYSNGNTSNDRNHYVEVEVYGRP
jgi:hypothetical protein